MNLFGLPIAAGIDLVMKTLRGLGILKDPEAEAAARKALNETLTAFYASTSGQLYQAARFMLFLGAMWDIFWNQSRAWVTASINMSTQGLAGYAELLPILWLYMGPETWAVIKEIAAAWKAGAEAKRVTSETDSARFNEDRERRRREDK